MLDVEVISLPSGSERANHAMQLVASASRTRLTRAYTGRKPIIVMWGPGGVQQQEIATKHKKGGGTVIFFDLGYFHRSIDGQHGSFRVTFNDPHPQKYLHLAGNKERFRLLNIRLTTSYNPEGPIVLCGMGRKSRVQYGYKGMAWEEKQRDLIQVNYPGVPIIYRPKPHKGCVERLDGTGIGYDRPTAEVLTSARLAVCHHSNIAVDCAILGVPCVAYDGAGVTLWPSTFGHELVVPPIEERQQFLERLAWFNWHRNEIPACLDFIERNYPKIRAIGART